MNYPAPSPNNASHDTIQYTAIPIIETPANIHDTANTARTTSTHTTAATRSSSDRISYYTDKLSNLSPRIFIAALAVSTLILLIMQFHTTMQIQSLHSSLVPKQQNDEIQLRQSPYASSVPTALSPSAYGDDDRDHDDDNVRNYDEADVESQPIPTGSQASPPHDDDMDENEESIESSTATAASSTTTATTRLSFPTYMKEFPFNAWYTAQSADNKELTEKYTEDFLYGMSQFIQLEPLIPINESCTPPPLPSPDTINCGAYPNAFGSSGGRKRSTPAKVAHMIQFGFDVDVLEVHLNELYDVVDYFFILESTHTHHQSMSKELLWEKVKHQPRFEKFNDKVVHLVVDDGETAVTSDEKQSIWHQEGLAERRRWQKFLEWNTHTNYFSDTDVMGFGDADEIASRMNVYLLKHCEISGPVDVGIWFPYGLIDHAFRTDWPVSPQFPYSLGDPTYWQLNHAKAYQPYPTRMRGTSALHLLGGMHMTNHRYLPYLLVKAYTGSEFGCGPDYAQRIESYVNNNEFMKMEMEVGHDNGGTKHGDRWKLVSEVRGQLNEIMVMPWFLQCNIARYDYWNGGHDTRLD